MKILEAGAGVYTHVRRERELLIIQYGSTMQLAR